VVSINLPSINLVAAGERAGARTSPVALVARNDKETGSSGACRPNNGILRETHWDVIAFDRRTLDDVYEPPQRPPFLYDHVLDGLSQPRSSYWIGLQWTRAMTGCRDSLPYRHRSQGSIPSSAPARGCMCQRPYSFVLLETSTSPEPLHSHRAMKMNWNNAQLDEPESLTHRTAGRVGGILKHV
jgi:hypothetical protein